MYLAFTQAARPELATLGFTLVLSVPLWCPPVARYFNMEPLMFNLFGKEKNNVYNLPVPKVEPPKEEEKPATTYYRLGITSNGRVSFQMGYSEITMNKQGVQNLISQLAVFRDQLPDEEDTSDGNSS